MFQKRWGGETGGETLWGRLPTGGNLLYKKKNLLINFYRKGGPNIFFCKKFRGKRGESGETPKKKKKTPRSFKPRRGIWGFLGKKGGGGLLLVFNKTGGLGIPLGGKTTDVLIYKLFFFAGFEFEKKPNGPKKNRIVQLN